MSILPKEYTVVLVFLVSSMVAVLYMIRTALVQYTSDTINNISKRCHAFSSNALSATYNHAVKEFKDELFYKMREYIILNQGHVMEIGAGSGGSLDFYPKGIKIKLTALEPNEYCRYYLKKNITPYNDITLERFVINNGENMKDIPSNSIGCLISTIVLCSVQDQVKVLNEIKRILTPGGRFFFMEHVAAPKSSWLSTYQIIANKVWRACFDGCNLNRDTAYAIETTGFSNVTYKRFNARLNYAFKGLKPHIVGYAVK